MQDDVIATPTPPKRVPEPVPTWLLRRVGGFAEMTGEPGTLQFEILVQSACDAI